MTTRKTSLTAIALTVTLGLGIGALALRAASEDESGSARSPRFLAQDPSPAASQFRTLDLDLNRALVSGDPYAIARRGAEVRAFQVPVNTQQREQKVWRREKLELWIAAVEGVHKAIDPSFDVTDRPAFNVAPMAKKGVASNSGMDPRAIRDDLVRVDYERRIEDNAKKARVHTYQIVVRRLDAEWTEDLKSHIASQYSLTAAADRADINEAIQKRIGSLEEQDRLRALLLTEAAPAAVFVSDSISATP